MSQVAEQFTYQELIQLSVIIQVDIRVSDTLGLETSDEQIMLFDKVQKLIQQMGKDLHYLPQGEKP